jgi:hypothetical protein
MKINLKMLTYGLAVIVLVSGGIYLIVGLKTKKQYDSSKYLQMEKTTTSFFSSSPSKSDIYEAFDYSPSSGFSKKDVKVNSVNLLKAVGVEADMRAIMNSRSPCGARAHQAMVMKVSETTSYFVTFDCKNQCSGTRESMEYGGLTTSESTLLDQDFCLKLWGGEVTVLDLDGL